jgi:hypothetical protein
MVLATILMGTKKSLRIVGEETMERKVFLASTKYLLLTLSFWNAHNTIN